MYCVHYSVLFSSQVKEKILTVIWWQISQGIASGIVGCQNSSLKILVPFSEECYSFLKVICHTILITNKMTMFSTERGSNG